MTDAQFSAPASQVSVQYWYYISDVEYLHNTIRYQEVIRARIYYRTTVDIACDFKLETSSSAFQYQVGLLQQIIVKYQIPQTSGALESLTTLKYQMMAKWK